MNKLLEYIEELFCEYEPTVKFIKRINDLI